MNDYTPIIKSKGFDPSPIAGNIPFFADSYSNPKCKGTALYREFWEEQIDRCKNGYTTGGLFIPPKMYYFLNFTIIDGVGSGKIYPDFLDLQYELYRLEHEIRNDPSVLGMTIPKARRKGLSFFGNSLLNHGMRFTDSYRAGVAGGHETYVDGFRQKLYRVYNNTVPEFKMNHLKRNDNVFTLGYEESTDRGDETTEIATMLFRTMGDKATKFEGEYFHDVIAEEAGEFDLAENLIISVGPALKNGEEFIGKFWLYGTGGKMSKGGKTFQAIYHNNESYSLKNVFVPGKRYYPPYVRIKKGSVKTPNLDKLYPNLAPEQLLGCEDIVAAEKSLKETEVKLAKNPDRTKLREHLQNYPKTVEDVFTSSGSNNFNPEILFSNMFRINSLSTPNYGLYKLEWVKDADGQMVIPLKVTARAAKLTDKEWELVLIHKHPLPHFKDLDIIGIDGYNEDKTTSTKSQGAIIGLRRNDKIISEHEVDGILPICVYYARPPRKEKFWEISLQLSVYYNALHNTMISAESDAIIKYYQDQGAKKFLARRPRAFDSLKTEQLHEFGVKMNSYSKPRMLGAIQTWVEDWGHINEFPKLSQDLIAYDDENIGTDWDLADALGICLTRIIDMGRKIPQQTSDVQEDPMDMGQWINGELVTTASVISTNEDKPWLKLPSAFKDGL